MPRRIEGAEPLGAAREPDFGNRLLTGQQLLTPKEAAHFLHVSEILARQGADAGRRPAIRAIRSLNSVPGGRLNRLRQVSAAAVYERAVGSVFGVHPV